MDAARMRRGGTAYRRLGCAERRWLQNYPAGLHRHAGACETRVAALLDEGIDFVGDPVVGHDEGQESADDEEDDAGAFPESGEGRVLHGQVDEIGGAVEDVGDQAEEAELQQAF